MVDDAPKLSSPTHSSVDTVFLGTSPLVLCHALFACTQGRSVAILDRNQCIGGAWHAGNALGFTNVEAAVHLIENRPEVYSHLERVGVPISDADVDCWGQYGYVRIPLAITRAVAFGGVLAKSLARGNFSKSRTNATSLARSVARIRSPFRYPVGGAATLLERLLSELAVFGVSPQLGVHVHRADITRDRRGGKLQTSIGDVHFRRVGIASRAHCPLTIDGEQLHFATRRTATCCLALHVDRCDEVRFSYVELLGRGPIRRVRNLSSLVQPTPAQGARLLSVQLRSPPSDGSADSNSDRDFDGERVVEALIAQRLLPPLTRLLGQHRGVYTHDTIADGELKRLAASLGDAMHPMHTTDFGEELTALLRRTESRCATPAKG